MGNEKIQDFTDLRVWQEAHKLALAVYTFTKKFPKEEIFALTSQMRRAASSVTSNIAEGFGRRSSKDKAHFYTMASASVYELRNQTILAVDLGYVSANVSSATQSNAIIVQKMLTALIKTIERP
jgi:four helix bundle protein